MVIDMAFSRKWVSDSNLDKLWHETIEKKEANKQRRSPDFCKEAILSATLKRISSEMIMKKISSKVLNNYTCESDQTMVTVKSQDYVEDRGIEISAEDSCDYETEDKVFSVDNGMDVITTKILDMDSNVSVEMIAYNGESPKRKWSDEDDLVSAHQCPASPAKRQKRKGLNRKTSSKGKSSSLRSRRSQSPTRISIQDHETCNDDFKKDKSKQITAVHSIKLANTSDFTTGLLSPVKSMVNSISEMSLGSPLTCQSSSGSWCSPVVVEADTDPLELDGFFKTLKNVTT